MEQLKKSSELDFLVGDVEIKNNTKFKKYTLNLLRFMFACLFLVTSLICISIAMSNFNNVNSAENFKKYDDFILPLVMQDPEDFNENTPPSQKTMLNTCIWSLAMEKKDDMSVYDENQDMVINLDDIQNRCKDIFNYEINAQNIDDSEESFYHFDKDNSVFKVKSISGTDRYTPYTASVSKSDNEIILNVGYAVPSEQFDNNMEILDKVKIEKYKTYKLKIDENTDKMYVSAVE